MNEIEPTDTSGNNTIHWPSFFQFGMSGLGLLAVWSLALLACLEIFLQTLVPQTGSIDARFTVLAFNWGAAGLLLLAAMVLSGARLLEKDIKPGKRWQAIKHALHPRRLIWIWPLILVAGQYLVSLPKAYIFLPPIHLLAISIPLVWLLWLGIRRLPKGSPQRELGVFNAGILLGPSLVVVLEIIAVALITVAAVVYISQNPEIKTQFERFFMQFLGSEPTVDNILAGPMDLFNNRAVVGLALLYFSVVIPLIEEIIKPIGVWLLGARKLRPVDGMVIGMISGAGFAAFEYLNAFTPEVPWALMVTLRATTCAMHIFTGGLTGAALAEAWQTRKYLRLVAAYTLAVLIHAIWNGAAILFSLSNFFFNLVTLREAPVVATHLQVVSTIMVGGMTVGCFYLIIKANSQMRQKVVVEYAVGLVNELDKSQGAKQSDDPD